MTVKPKAMSTSKDWDLKIESNGKKPSGIFNLKELFSYIDLLFLLVKRDFIALYKQTVLGPIWVVIQPILTTVTYLIVFTKIAKVGTADAPPLLFYMIGVTVWAYFADCVIKTSDTFIVNQGIFGKVYFPRLIVPLSLVVTNLIKFGIQFTLFILIYTFYIFFVDWHVDYGPTWQLVLIPLLLLIMIMLGLGSGLIISALTTKYRDLRFLIQFGIQLAMFATPIVWPLTNLDSSVQKLLMLNPMTSVIETFKVGFFGADFGIFSWEGLSYSFVLSLIVLLIGMRLFTRIERSFMDTI